MPDTINNMRERAVWLERLASRCKMHGYADQAAKLRDMVALLNAYLPVELRAGPHDPACLEPVHTVTVTEFCHLVEQELTAAGIGVASKRWTGADLGKPAECETCGRPAEVVRRWPSLQSLSPLVARCPVHLPEDDWA